jgi:EAL and modified HD-GYP domain-containing signal transduction protein
LDVFVARQPILDAAQDVFGYELLFRSNAQSNFFDGQDRDHASARVIDRSLLTFDWVSLTRNKRAFINVTRRALLEEQVRVLPPQATVVELLEDIEPDEPVVAACAALKRGGYLVALDDFQYRPEYEPLLALADIVKVDFKIDQSEAARALHVQRLRPRGVRLLAEKVETREEFAQAKALGYALFQGYFFARPEILSTREVSGNKLSYLRLLQQFQSDEIDYERIGQIVKGDMALSLKLLRFLNSAAFGWRSRVENIKQALVLLGERPLRRWACLVAFAQLGGDQPGELVRLSLVRARFCELLAPEVRLPGEELKLFLAGLLSTVDALIGRPLKEILGGLALPPAVKAVLLGGPSPLADAFALALAYERGDWGEVARLGQALRLDEAKIPKLYEQSLAWAESIFAAT